MTPPSWLRFFRRTFPSANMVLVLGRGAERPILFDSGFGADLDETERLLREAGVPPERLALLVNSHYHCDHAGGNGGLQARHGLPVAAHRWEAEDRKSTRLNFSYANKLYAVFCLTKKKITALVYTPFMPLYRIPSS